MKQQDVKPWWMTDTITLENNLPHGSWRAVHAHHDTRFTRGNFCPKWFARGTSGRSILPLEVFAITSTWQYLKSRWTSTGLHYFFEFSAASHHCLTACPWVNHSHSALAHYYLPPHTERHEKYVHSSGMFSKYLPTEDEDMNLIYSCNCILQSSENKIPVSTNNVDGRMQVTEKGEQVNIFIKFKSTQNYLLWLQTYTVSV